MAKKKALVLGASSLVGRYLLKLLLQDDAYDEVTVYARRHIKAVHNKLVEKIIEPQSFDSSVNADDVFCCIDSTIKKAGSQSAFEQSDLDFPLKVAKLQKENGSSKFLLISSRNANVNSNKIYDQVKGKTEDAIKKLGFSSLYIFRPALVTGSKKEEAFRQKIKNFLFKVANPLLIGPLKKYRSVSAKALGRAMIYYAIKKEPATKIVLSNEIKEFEL